MLGVEDTDFGLLSRSLSLVGFSLQKVCNRSGLLPERIVKSTVHLRGLVNPVGVGGSELFLNPKLRLFCLWTRS